MTLTVQAPAGAHFEMEEVKTKKGAESLGEVPILVWDEFQPMVDTYGEEGIRNIADGTSLRVSFQSIARRLKVAVKAGEEDGLNDKIAAAQVAFRPGKRVGGAAKPENKAARAAKSASEKIGNPDLVARFLEKVARGEIGAEDLESLSL